MNYKDIRTKFATLSGRYDLITATYEDNGADFFLNAGQKMLDRMQETGKSKAKSVTSISIGTYYKSWTNLRAVKEVWVGNSTELLSKLAKYTLSELREFYGEQLCDVDQGVPQYWAPAVIRPVPDNLASTGLSSYYDIGDLMLDDDHYTYNGIVWAPPVDQTMYLSVYGLWYSPTLSATLSGDKWTQTKSFWTEEHPDILLYAALYKLETFYRNTEGAKDWLNALTLDLSGIDKDLVEEDIDDVNQMEG